MSGQPRSPFVYTILRAVPHVERGECINVGVVMFCRPLRFLGARVGLDEARLRALAPDADASVAAEIGDELEAILRVAAGDASAGPIARLSKSERFHWLSSARSTILQRSDVHTGLTADPAATLERLFAELVKTPAQGK